LVVLLGAALGAFLTWQQVRVGRDQLRANVESSGKLAELGREQLDHTLHATLKEQELVRQGQITDRFTRAIDQLGSEKIDIRVGGIYALEQIAGASEEHYAPVMDILLVFLREHSPWPPSRPGQWAASAPIELIPPLAIRAADVQTALTVISRQERGKAQNRSRVQVYTPPGSPEMVVGFETYIDLRDCDLRRASLTQANLNQGNLVGAHLEGAGLVMADLGDASLEYAHLDGANLMGARLQQASLRFAQLDGANVATASLNEARLQGADLSGVLSLTQAQADSAFTHETTKLPPGIRHSARKAPAEPP
jgi:hypothetical protein